jgi:general secretion pathway protein B
MSYILDALKKAAEQRGAGSTVLLRPSAPLARVGRWRRLPWIVAGVLLLLNLAGLGYLMWPRTITTAPAPVPPAKVALIQPIVPPPAPPPTQVIPAEPPRAALPVTPPSANAPAVASTPPASSPATPPRVIIDKPAGGKPVARVVPDTPAPARPAPADPRAAAGAPTKADGQRFKLEVLSFSDVPAQRLVFINGRRYREGETMDGGVKVEEIREDSVILSEAGQRFTLR